MILKESNSIRRLSKRFAVFSVYCYLRWQPGGLLVQKSDLSAVEEAECIDKYSFSCYIRCTWQDHSQIL